MTDAPTSPGGGGGGSPESGSPRSGGSVREQDRFLPIANISRIMKKAIPPNGKIAKDAKETVQDCVSEFISFITSEASKKCQREKRKTINGDDLLWAMATLGFEDYIEPLKVYLQKYRESVDHPNIEIEQSVNTSVVPRGADNSVERRGLLPKNPSKKKRYNNRKRYLAMTSKEQQAYLERNRQYKRDRKNQYSSNLLNQCIPVQKQSHEDYDSSIYIPTDHFPAVQDKFEQANNMTESEDEDDDINILGVDGIDYISYREQNHYISDMQDDPYDYIYQNLPSAHHYLKPVPNCSHCNAKRFQYEKPTFCCMGGNVKIVTPDIPHEMYRLYTSQDSDAKYFRDNIRIVTARRSLVLALAVEDLLTSMRSTLFVFLHLPHLRFILLLLQGRFLLPSGTIV